MNATLSTDPIEEQPLGLLASVTGRAIRSHNYRAVMHAIYKGVTFDTLDCSSAHHTVVHAGFFTLFDLPSLCLVYRLTQCSPPSNTRTQPVHILLASRLSLLSEVGTDNLSTAQIVKPKLLVRIAATTLPLRWPAGSTPRSWLSGLGM